MRRVFILNDSMYDGESLPVGKLGSLYSEPESNAADSASDEHTNELGVAGSGGTMGVDLLGSAFGEPESGSSARAAGRTSGAACVGSSNLL